MTLALAPAPATAAPRGLSLTERAVIVTLTFTGMTLRKQDKRATRTAQDAHHAAKESGAYVKKLFGNSLFDDVVKTRAAIRNENNAATLPWGNAGERLLPNAQYFDYQTKVRDWRERDARAVSAAVSQYGALLSHARMVQGDLFNASDYPSERRVREAFGMDVSYMPVPEVADVRVALPADVLDAMRAEVETRIHDAYNSAATAAWSRLHARVEMIKSRCGDEDARIYDTLLDGARELCDTLSRLNVTGDVALDRMRVKVQQLVNGVSTDTLRKDAMVRQQTAAHADAILSAMSAFYQPTATDTDTDTDTDTGE